MIFLLTVFTMDLLFIFLILYFFDEERKLPRIQRTSYTKLKEALLQFEDGQKIFAYLSSNDRTIFAAKFFLYGKDGNKYFDFSRSFGIDQQDLISFEKTLVFLSNIDENLARDFVGLIIEEADYNYIRTNSVPYRFQLL